MLIKSFLTTNLLSVKKVAFENNYFKMKGNASLWKSVAFILFYISSESKSLEITSFKIIIKSIY